MSGRRRLALRPRGAALLVVVAVPSLLLVACDGILGIPGEVERESAVDAASDAHDVGDATLDGPDLDDASDGDAGDTSTPPGSETGPGEGGVDGGCDALAPFTTIAQITELDQLDAGAAALDQGSVRLTTDERTIAFTRVNAVTSSYDLYMATRSDAGTFGAPTVIGGLAGSTQEYSPNLSDDLLGILFEQQEQATGYSYLYEASRGSASDSFNAPVLLGGISDSTYTAQPFARGDLLTVVFVQANAQKAIEVDEATSTELGGTYASSKLLGASAATNTYGKNAPVLSADQQWIYYSDDSAGDAAVNLDIYVAPAGGGAAVPLTSLNSAHDERGGWISPDACRFYFDSDRDNPGGPRNLYVATRSPH